MSNRTPDQELRLTTAPVYDDRIDYGGMFKGSARVYFDPAEGVDLPYLAVVSDGWGAGRGKRHATKEEAVADLERLLEAEFG